MIDPAEEGGITCSFSFIMTNLFVKAIGKYEVLQDVRGSVDWSDDDGHEIHIDAASYATLETSTNNYLRLGDVSKSDFNSVADEIAWIIDECEPHKNGHVDFNEKQHAALLGDLFEISFTGFFLE